MMPWASVGGCGASTGSVTGDMQLKWIGSGISGRLIDIEMLAGNSFLPDTGLVEADDFDGHMRIRNTSFVPSLCFHPRAADFKLTIPFIIKNGYSTSTGFLSDISLDISRGWGMNNNFRTACALNFPTGRYRIETSALRYLLPEMQMGSGMLGGSVRAEYNITRDWGLINAGASYTASLFTMHSSEFDYDTTIDRPVSVSKKFSISRDGAGGVNDLGRVLPDNIGLFIDLGIKANPLIHGISLAFGVPFRDGEYTDFQKAVDFSFTNDPSTDNYRPDKESAQEYADTVTAAGGALKFVDPLVVGTDEMGRWVVIDNPKTVQPAPPSLTLQYSMEKGDLNLPLLLGVAFRMEFEDGVQFGGFSAGAGFKFGIY